MDLTVINMPSSEDWLYEQERQDRNGPPIDEAVLRFYGPDGEEGYNGLTLEKFLNMSDKEFAHSYCYQGVLFPLLESGSKNAAGPPITRLCFERFNAINENSPDTAEILRGNLRRAFHRCLDFLRFTFLDKNKDDDPKAFPGLYAIAVPRADHKSFKNRLGSKWRESYDQQYKWLARVIKCCRVLGLQKEARALYLGIRYLYRRALTFKTLPRPPAMFVLYAAAMGPFNHSIDDYFQSPEWLKDYEKAEARISDTLYRDPVKKYVASLDWVNGDIKTIEERYSKQLIRDAEKKKESSQSDEDDEYADYDKDNESKSDFEEDPKKPCLDWPDTEDESEYETRDYYFDRYGRVRRGVALDERGDPVNPDAEVDDEDAETQEERESEENEDDDADGSGGDESDGDESDGDDNDGAGYGLTEATNDGDADDESSDEDDAADKSKPSTKPSNLKRKRDDHDDEDDDDHRPTWLDIMKLGVRGLKIPRSGTKSA